MSLLQVLSSTFLHGSPCKQFSKEQKNSMPIKECIPKKSVPPVKGMKTIQGKVVCNSNDKTVSVEVTRLAPHPKYKRRIRIKNKFQAHDPENVFNVGDLVQLEKTRPISKTKTFLAVPVAARNVKKPKEDNPLDLPLESQQS